MSDQSTDPAPTTGTEPDAPEDTGATSADPVEAQGEPQNVFTSSSGDVVTTTLDESGAPVSAEINSPEEAVANAAAAAMPSAEYGYRPEPVPGPSVEEIQAMTLAEYTPPSAQEIIMARAQHQADAIIAAAEAEVQRLDEIEAEAQAASA